MCVGLVMFFCADGLKLQCCTTNKSLLTEMPVFWLILFYLQEETTQSRLFASHSQVVLLIKLIA